MKRLFVLLALCLAVLSWGQIPPPSPGVSGTGVNNILAGKQPGLFSDIENGLANLNIAGSFATGPSLLVSGNNSSTFTGWYSTLGTPTGRPFNYFDVSISTWNKAAVPTLLRGQVLPAFTIVGATNTSPIVVNYTPLTGTTSTITTGDKVRITNVLGNTAANASASAWTVTVVDSTHFSLNGSTGNGAYTSGGVAVDDNIVLGEGYASLANVPMGTDTLVRVNLNKTVTDTTDNLIGQWIADGNIGRTLLSNLSLYPATTYMQTGYTTATASGVGTMPVNWTLDGTQSCHYVRMGMGPVVSSFDDGAFSTSTIASAGSTISAFGGPVGAQGSFNRLEFDVTPSTAGTSLPTSFRCRVRLGNATGTILGDKVLSNVSMAVGYYRRLRFDFVNQISGGSQNLWFEVIGNQAFGMRMLVANAFPIASGYAQAQYQTTNSIDGNTWLNNGTQYSPYARASLMDYSFYMANGSDDVKFSIQQVALSSTAPYLLLPSQLYAVAGGPETWLQWDNVCTNGYGVGPSETFYNFSTTWTKAAQFTQGLLYQPLSGDAGTYSVPITVWHGGNPWQTVTPTMTVVAASNGNGTTRKVLTIGDSTTAAGYYLAQAKRLFDSGSGLAVTLLGTKTQTVNAADGTSETVNDEGVSGQTATWFYTNASSPFVFTGAFNFSTYMSNNSYSMTTGDWVLINVKINDEFNYTTDAGVQGAITTRLAAINGMIASIHAYNANIRIGILSGIPPYRTQDGFGTLYGNTSQIARNRYRRNWEMVEKFDLMTFDNATQVAAKVYYLPFGCNWDTKNNQQTANTVALTVNGATNASPIVVSVTAPCQVVTGDSVVVASVGGNTAANGTFTVTQVDTTHFKLNGTTGNGAYTSGGTATVPIHANMRNGTQITRDANSVHPATAGYYQLGDQLWASLMGIG